VNDTPSPMKYNSPKPEAILIEDKVVEKLKLKIPAANVKIIKAETVFE
jgi:zinc protease